MKLFSITLATFSGLALAAPAADSQPNYFEESEEFHACLAYRNVETCNRVAIECSKRIGEQVPGLKNLALKERKRKERNAVWRMRVCEGAGDLGFLEETVRGNYADRHKKPTGGV